MRELFLGSFAYIIPAGVTVDGTVVSATYKPDIVPLANWTDYGIGSVLGFVPGVEEEDRSYMGPNARGGWKKIPKRVVVQDYIDIKTREMGELLLRLQFGLAAPIVEGTAQTIFGSSVRRIEAWVKFHIRQENGQDLSIGDMYCYVELKKGLVADGKVSEPEFRLTCIPDVGGVLVAGNSIVFPTQV